MPDPAPITWPTVELSDAMRVAYATVMQNLMALTPQESGTPRIVTFTPSGRETYIDGVSIGGSTAPIARHSSAALWRSWRGTVPGSP
jgi:hypothetical protein